MSFIGLTLTKRGRNLIASAISEDTPLNITHIELGEGMYNGTFSEKKELSKKVMEIPVKSVKRNDGEVVINCDFNSRDALKAFYFREVGIIGNGVLCYYDNSGDDAEYIDPEIETVVKQKRLRFTLSISSDVTVAVKIDSELYALKEETEAEIHELREETAEKIDGLKKSVSDGKSNVAEAITDMGINTVSTEDSPATFDILAENIRAITPSLSLQENTAKAKVGSNEVTQQIGYPMGGNIVPGTSDQLLISAGNRVYFTADYKLKSLGGDAEAAHVLTGKTFSSNKAGREKAGTMANQGAKTAALNCGGTYTIPAGYHNGSGKVTANSLASQTGVDSGKAAAGAGQILTGYQAYVNGSKVSGTMANQGAKTAALNCDGTYTIPAGYHNGSGKVTANSLASQTGVDSGKAAAGAGQILTGYQAYVNGVKITGTMPDQRKITNIDARRLNNGDKRYEVAVAAGYHGYNWANNWFEYITYAQLASDIGLTAGKIYKGNTIIGIEGTATGDATATASDILKDKTAYVNGAKVTGTMVKFSDYFYHPNASMNFRGGRTSYTDDTGATVTCSATDFISVYIGAKGFHENTSHEILMLASRFGNASASSVLSGKTFTSSDGFHTSGTMVNNGAVSKELSAGEEYTIPAGYHNGSGKAKAKSLSSQTGVDNGKTAAGAGQILTGYQAWVNGSKVTGTMTNRGAVTTNQSGADGSKLAEVVYTIPAGFHNGNGKIKTFGAIGTYKGDPTTIKCVSTTQSAFLFKRHANSHVNLAAGNSFDVNTGAYADYRVMNFAVGTKVELSSSLWACGNRSIMIFIRRYAKSGDVYEIKATHDATNAIYVQHGASVTIKETSITNGANLTFVWDAANGKITMTVENVSSQWIMHDLYVHVL